MDHAHVDNALYQYRCGQGRVEERSDAEEGRGEVRVILVLAGGLDR